LWLPLAAAGRQDDAAGRTGGPVCWHPITQLAPAQSGCARIKSALGHLLACATWAALIDLPLQLAGSSRSAPLNQSAGESALAARLKHQPPPIEPPKRRRRRRRPLYKQT